MQQQQRQRSPPVGRTVTFLAILAGISFYSGYHISSKNVVDFENNGNGSPLSKLKECHDYQQRINQINTEVNQLIADSTTKASDSGRNGNTNKDSSFIQAMARVSKHELMSAFDNFGVATLESPLSDEALIIYNHADAIPDQLLQSSPAADEHTITRIDNITEAMQKCGSLNVQFAHTPAGFRPQCHIWIPAHNLPAFHVNRWMRLSDATNNNKFDHNAPLKHVGSITTPTGVDRFDLPKFKPLISAHWNALLQFFEHADAVLMDIQKLFESNNIKPPPIKQINETFANEAITVMTVNQGQSDLLVNFFCAAQSRGLDLHRVLVFVTDEESKRLVEGFAKDLGVMVYFDKWNFATMPKGAASEKYGDETFTSMMFAKILCCLYINLSGYDALYQDVDVVYYRNPLDFFSKYGSGSQNYDIIFQHDGSSQSRYAPYSSNSGFFYSRANKKVQYLFTSLLYHGDLIRKTRTHQQVLTQLLLEHSSLFGMKVKVLDRHDYYEFPGGYHFNYDHSTMHQIISGELKPYIFHMFWTDGKETKVKFLKQFGEWYVNDDCREGSMNNTHGLPASIHCCSAKPLISCYFKDRPSVVPCNDSPSYDKNAKSFWDQ
ncbi:hypothetical protein ACHAXM_003546 [Skeletonema potamos]